MSKSPSNQPQLPSGKEDVNFIMKVDGRRAHNSFDLNKDRVGGGQGRVHPAFGGRRRQNLSVLFGFTVIFFAVLFSSLVFLMANSEKSQATAKEKIVVVEKEAPIEMMDVLVPVNQIDPGAKLEPSLFKLERRPKISVPDGAFRSYEEIKGNYARSVIPKSQPISREFVSQVRPPNPVIANIPPGYRAVTINVTATTGVEGWATAGASVDVHWISDVLGERAASLIVQNAKVLSAERQADPNQNPGAPIPTTVTLLVNEKDAQKISLASTGGSLMLHLRGAGDTGKGSNSSTVLTFKDLVGRGAADKKDSDLEGYARTRLADGSIKEWALLNGKVVEKH